MSINLGPESSNKTLNRNKVNAGYPGGHTLPEICTVMSNTAGNGIIFVYPSTSFELAPKSENSWTQAKRLNSFLFSVRVYNVFKNAGIESLADLLSFSPGQLMRTRLCGQVTLREIKRKLYEVGLSLAPEQHPRTTFETESITAAKIADSAVREALGIV